jgi:hypothetical protein
MVFRLRGRRLPSHDDPVDPASALLPFCSPSATNSWWETGSTPTTAGWPRPSRPGPPSRSGRSSRWATRRPSWRPWPGPTLRAGRLVVDHRGAGPHPGRSDPGGGVPPPGLPLRGGRGDPGGPAARYRARGYAELPPSRRMARVPRGPRSFRTRKGGRSGPRAPGPGVARVYLLPGVPDEMKAHLQGSEVLPAPGPLTSPAAGAPPPWSPVRTTGIPESVAGGRSRRPGGIPSDAGVNLQYRPSVEGVELRFSGPGPGRGAPWPWPWVPPRSWRPGGTGASGPDPGELVLDRLAARGGGWRWRRAAPGGIVGGASPRFRGVPGSSWAESWRITTGSSRPPRGAGGDDPRTHGAVSAPVAGPWPGAPGSDWARRSRWR